MQKKESNNKNQDSEGISFRDRFYYFYTEEFEEIIKKYKRGESVCLVLKLVYSAQLVSLMFAIELNKIIQSQKDVIFIKNFINVLDACKIFPLIQGALGISEEDSLTIFGFVSFFINLSMILYVLGRIILCMVEKRTIKRNYEILDEISSCFFQFYLHLFAVPFFEISVKCISAQSIVSVAILNAVFTILIGIILTLHDFDYCYIIKDFMCKRESNMTIVFFVQDLILCSLVTTDLGAGIFLVHLGFILTRLWDYYSQVPYYHIEVSIFYLQMNLIHFMFGICSILYELSYIQETSDLSIFFLAIVPPCFKLGTVLRIYRLAGIKHLYKNDIDSSITLDLYVRELNTLTELDYINYCQGENGILYEQLFTKHILTCEDAFSETKTCYCERFQKAQLEKDELLDNKFRRIFLVFYIMDTYQEFFDKAKKAEDSTKLRFSFVAYLIEIFNVPSKALTEVMFMKVINTDSTWKERYVIHSLIRQSDLAFYGFFHNSIIQNQRLDMMSTMEFDMTVKQLDEGIKQALVDKRDYFVFLCNDYIDISVVHDKGIQLIKSRNDLEQNLHKIYKLNPDSRKCSELSHIFIEFFDVQLRKLDQFMGKDKMNIKQLKLKMDIDVNLFDEKSVIIFITLLQPLGFVKRTTQSFQQMFGFPMERVINQTCNILMPQHIALHHDRFLDWFLENDRMKALEKGQLLNFGQRENGFIFSLYKRLRLDQFADDFGVSAYIIECNTQADYLMIDQNNQILEMTKRIYIPLFARHFGDKQCPKHIIRNFDLQLFMPYLFKQDIRVYNEDEYTEMDEFFQTTLIFPLEAEFLYLFGIKGRHKKRNLRTMLGALDFKNFGLMDVTFRKCRQDSSVKGIAFYFLEIARFKRLRKYSEKIEALQHLQEQIADFLKIDVQKGGNRTVKIDILDEDMESATGTEGKNSTANQFMKSKFVNDAAKQKKQKKEKQKEDKIQKSKSKDMIKLDKQKSLNMVSEDEEDDEQENEEDHEFKNSSLNQNSQLQFQSSMVSTSSLQQNNFPTNQPNSKTNQNSDQNKMINPQKQNVNKNQQQPAQIQESILEESFAQDENIEMTGRDELESREKTKEINKFQGKAYQNYYNQDNEDNKNQTLQNETLNTQTNQTETGLINTKDDQRQDNLLKKLINDPEEKDQQILDSLDEFEDKSKKTLKPPDKIIQKSQKNGEDLQKSQSKLIAQQLSNQTDSQLISIASQELNSNFLEGSSGGREGSAGSQDLISSNQDDILDNQKFIPLKNSLDLNEEKQDKKEQQNNSVYTQETKRTSEQRSVQSSKKTDFSMYVNRVAGKQGEKFVGGGGSSIHSSQAESRIQREAFIQVIITKFYPPLMQKITVFGVFVVLILIMTTSIFFFSIKSNFEKELKYFSNIVTSSNLMAEFCSVVKENEFIRLNQIPDLTQTPISDQQMERSQKLKYEFVNLFRQKIIQFMDDEDNQDYTQYLQEKTQTMIYFDVNGQQFKENYILVYYFIQIPNYAFSYAFRDDLDSRRFIYFNYVQIMSQITNIYDITRKQAVDELTSIETSLILTIVILEFLIVSAVMMSIPIYYLVQSMREEILNTCGTFTYEILQQSIAYYHTAVRSLENANVNEQEVDSQLEVFKKQKKRRAISTTTRLERSNIKLFVSSIVLVCVISIYPIVNFVITKEFLTEFTYNVNELAMVYLIKGNIATNYGTNYLRSTLKFDSFDPVLQKEMDTFLDQLTLQNTKNIKDLSNLVQNFESVKRFSKDEYVKIFLQSLNINICDTLQENPQILTAEVKEKLDIEMCKKVYKGVMNQGLILTLTTLYKTFSDMQLIYQYPDNQFKTAFSDFDSNVDVNQLDEISFYTASVIEMLRDFILSKTNLFYNNQIFIQLIIYFYALFIMGIALPWIWIKYIQYLGESIYETRQIMGVFPIDIILTNRYMTAFLERARKG